MADVEGGLNLHTVSGIIKAARGLLLDKVQPYRYGDTAMLVALNLALLEAKRIRPDFFVGHKHRGHVPQYENVSGEEIPIEAQFRAGFLFGIAAHVLLRDEEDVQDMRADTFMKRFEDIMTGITSTPIQGGTPSPQQSARSKQ